MKMTVEKMMLATEMLATIMRERRPMPLKGKYRIARMHAKMFPEYETASAQRDEMIKSYNNPRKIENVDPVTLVVTEAVSQTEFQVPEDRIDEFTANWKAIADGEIEIDIEPIPLDQLDLGNNVDGSIHANELLILGDLVA